MPASDETPSTEGKNEYNTTAYNNAIKPHATNYRDRQCDPETSARVLLAALGTIKI